MRADQPVVVLITGAGGGSLGHELIQALRLAETSYRIIATDVSPQSIGLYEADAARLLPPASHQLYLESLLQVCLEEGVQVVIPGSEPELRVLSRRRQSLIEVGIVPLMNSEPVVELGLDKSATIAALQAHGFEVPRSQTLSDHDSALAVTWFPCVVKPSRGASGSTLAFIAQDAEELTFFASYVRASGFTPVAQEYMGTPQDEYTVGVINTLSGAPVGSLAIRREILRGLSAKFRVTSRTRVPGEVLALSSGISQGSVVQASEIRRACESLALALRSQGPLNVQLRFVGGKIYPFEINPRFSGTCCLRALAGFNEPDILIRHHLLGEPVPVVAYETGSVVRGLSNRFIRDADLIG
jgi:carbamoyl-phosphate synthase large subunit